MKSGQFVRRLRPWCVVAPLLLASAWPAVAADAAEPTPAAAQQPAAHAHADVYATVNGQAISLREYEAAFANLMRQKFYHGQVPEGQMEAAREETRRKLIQRIVLIEEAERRGIKPDQQKVDEAVAGYDRQYAASPVWKERRESLLPGLKKQLGDQTLVAQLEQAVRLVPEPTDSEVKAYFDAHPDRFTEPEKLRLSAILLAVDPSSPVAAWKAAREEADAIYKRLLAGADFGETSRLHSNGKFAENGGDMGYLHRGMLPEALQERIDTFELGKVNAPMDTLEGVAIFRLDERVVAKKRDFDSVAQRAKDLLTRERQEEAWKTLVDKLIAGADVKINQQMTTGQREGQPGHGS